MRRTSLLLALGWILGISSAWAQEPSAPQVYQLDSSESFLAVLILYDRRTIVAGHDHGAQAMSFDGRVRWASDDVSACDVSIRVPVGSLKIDPPGLRARFGLKGETKPKTIGKIESNMWGVHVLDAAQFPDATFQSTRCVSAEGGVEVAGQLTIHGVSANAKVLMTVKADATSFHAQGVLNLTHADFGMKPFRALLGAVRNDEALQFHIDVKGRPAPQATPK